MIHRALAASLSLAPFLFLACSSDDAADAPKDAGTLDAAHAQDSSPSDAHAGASSDGSPADADAADASDAAPPPTVLLVVNDDSPTSVAIAAAYAEARSIGEILHVHCADSSLSEDNETIDWADYQSQIENPIRDFLNQYPSIQFIVTTRGIPIRVADAPTGETFPGRSLASLDSTLAALDYDKIASPQGAPVKITFNAPGGSATGTAWLNRYWNATVPFDHATFGGYLVTRLDGYTKEDALALIERAAASETSAPTGKVLLDIEPDFTIDDKSKYPAPIPGTTIDAEDGWGTWNADMAHANDVLTARSLGVILDTKQTFVGHQSGLLGYYSWGSNDDHYSEDAYHSLSFAPGAIGDTAVSTSARSFFAQSGGQSMIADLIAQGITGVKGYTDEPLLQAIASPTISLDRYSSGFTLAESFYAASHFVGWTDVVIGDPLTRPFPKRLPKKD